MADVTFIQVDKARTSRIVASPIAAVISESVQVPSNEPQEVASSLGIALKLQTLGFADT